jgi:predicted DNA-binding protein
MSGEASTMRINARLNDELAKKFRYLLKKTNQNMTQVIKDALERYFEEFSRSGVKAAKVLKKCGFIGCCEGASGLSRNYKKVLARSLKSKS